MRSFVGQAKLVRPVERVCCSSQRKGTATDIVKVEVRATEVRAVPSQALEDFSRGLIVPRKKYEVGDLSLFESQLGSTTARREEDKYGN